MSIPLTREQVRCVDRLAVSEFGMSGLVLMENAGRGAAEIVDREYGPPASALIICGTGNNGGDGFVIARHLSNRGWSVRIAVGGGAEKLTPDASVNAFITGKMRIPTTLVDSEQAVRLLPGLIRDDDVIVDALLGTGFAGSVREPAASLIRTLNDAQKRAMIAIDIPSGLDCDTGTPGGVAVKACHTVTFVGPKVGFAVPGAADYVGTVHVVDIGCPKELIDRTTLGM